MNIQSTRQAPYCKKLGYENDVDTCTYIGKKRKCSVPAMSAALSPIQFEGYIVGHR